MIPIPKLKATILYFANNTNQVTLGKVKLMKLFYFLDFGHVKKYGVPVTGDIYKNLDHGPIPQTILNLVNMVEDEPNESILSDTIFVERVEGQRIHRIVPKRQFTTNDAKLFSETELAQLQEVAKRFGRSNTEFIENASHQEAPWKLTKQLDEIPYALATADADSTINESDIILLSKI